MKAFILTISQAYILVKLGFFHRYNFACIIIAKKSKPLERNHFPFVPLTLLNTEESFGTIISS